ASPVWNRFQLFNEGVYSHDTHRLTTLLVCIPSAKESTLPPDPEPQSSLDRAERVQQLLGVAWGLGFNTYPQLIEYVREQTGQGCSRRAIAQFKQRQGLL
ncbi:MAG: hypothetical protein WBA57_14055, partial [Elainellaceae cyanobacterium]